MQKLHNEGIKSELDTWLTFLGSDEPEYIVKLIQEYPQFKSMYEDLYNMCLNIEGVMNMFSKELQILDRNTVKYMIDELQDQLDEKVSELTTTKSELDTANDTIAKLQAELEKYKNS